MSCTVIGWKKRDNILLCGQINTIWNYLLNFVFLKSAQGSLVLILVTFTCYVSVCIFCSKHGVKFYKMCRVLHNQKGSVQINACDKSVCFFLIVIIVDHNWAQSFIKVVFKTFIDTQFEGICLQLSFNMY